MKLMSSNVEIYCNFAQLLIVNAASVCKMCFTYKSFFFTFEYKFLGFN